MYAFYENTHYTEKIKNVPFYFFSDFQIARFLKRAFHTVSKRIGTESYGLLKKKNKNENKLPAKDVTWINFDGIDSCFE